MTLRRTPMMEMSITWQENSEDIWSRSMSIWKNINKCSLCSNLPCNRCWFQYAASKRTVAKLLESVPASSSVFLMTSDKLTRTQQQRTVSVSSRCCVEQEYVDHLLLKRDYKWRLIQAQTQPQPTSCHCCEAWRCTGGWERWSGGQWRG